MNERLYLPLILLFFVAKSCTSENASSNWLQRLCAYCTCCASTGQVNQHRLLPTIQSEESLLRQRDKLIKNNKAAERRLAQAKKNLGLVKTEDFREHAKERINLAEKNYRDAHTALANFYKKYPECPREAKSK